MSTTTLTAGAVQKLDVLRYPATQAEVGTVALPVMMYPLSPRSKFLNKLIGAVSLPDGFEIVALRRNGEIITNSVMDFLRKGDQLILSFKNVPFPELVNRLVL